GIGHRVRSFYTIGRLEFHYTLPEASQIRITFFDMQGRRVMTLADGAEQAGPQQHIFNYRQTSIKPGYYAYTIEAMNNTYSGKFMVGR
ncbi:MAG: T9SS type A sorting domain-containing protein, partial [Bacteroidota bacterium]